MPDTPRMTERHVEFMEIVSEGWIPESQGDDDTRSEILVFAKQLASGRLATYHPETVRKLAEGIRRGDFTYDEIADTLEGLSGSPDGGTE